MTNILSVKDVAKQLGVTVGRVRQFIEAGRLQAVNISPAHHPIYVVSEEEMRRFAAVPRRPGRRTKRMEARMRAMDEVARAKGRRKRGGRKGMVLRTELRQA
jgi:hypothetical protein